MVFLFQYSNKLGPVYAVVGTTYITSSFQFVQGFSKFMQMFSHPASSVILVFSGMPGLSTMNSESNDDVVSVCH
jgi:hypothetical protein